MAEEARVIQGIDWRRAFPFTHLFRSFRIAIHPSKLALGLIALLCLYVGGLLLDRLWPVGHLAVPGEIALYAEYGTSAGTGDEFLAQRDEARREVEQAYAAL